MWSETQEGGPRWPCYSSPVHPNGDCLDVEEAAPCLAFYPFHSSPHRRGLRIAVDRFAWAGFLVDFAALLVMLHLLPPLLDVVCSVLAPQSPFEVEAHERLILLWNSDPIGNEDPDVLPSSSVPRDLALLLASLLPNGAGLTPERNGMETTSSDLMRKEGVLLVFCTPLLYTIEGLPGWGGEKTYKQRKRQPGQ